MTTKTVVLAMAMVAGCCGAVGMAQGMAGMGAAQDGKPLPSPRKMADVDLFGTKIAISYGAPSVRGRKIFGGLVPYTTWWRTGANEATSFETTGNLKVGTLNVPAGKYTLVTLPSEGAWQLVVCKHTGQWGTERFEKDDLGKTNMTKQVIQSPQEVMSIDFEKTAGGKTQLHVKWADTDAWVPVERVK